MPDAAQKTHDDWRIPEALWARSVPLLPPRKPHPVGGHRPRVDARTAMDAIFVVRRTGCQGGALDATGICSHRAAHRRCHEWREAAVFVALWEQGLVAYDAWQGIDGEWLALDGARTKAPLGGGKGGQASDRPWPERHEAQRAHRRRRCAHRPRGGRHAPP